MAYHTNGEFFNKRRKAAEDRFVCRFTLGDTEVSFCVSATVYYNGRVQFFENEYSDERERQVLKDAPYQTAQYVWASVHYDRDAHV
jgi:hypothetical protein